ncbi:Uncharacterised protein [Vibrio cholerae]|nr:Uncharacterised protein [Vibrio cholerae]
MGEIRNAMFLQCNPAVVAIPSYLDAIASHTDVRYLT